MTNGFETLSATMRPLWLLTVQAPVDDVDRIMSAVVDITPLAMGAFDSNAFVGAPGTERYRPLAGAVAGAETQVRLRPGVVEITFELAVEQSIIEKVVETIFQVHSYQEPVIRLQSLLGSRSKGRDDKDNPNRWWNTTGDWKTPKPG